MSYFDYKCYKNCTILQIYMRKFSVFIWIINESFLPKLSFVHCYGIKLEKYWHIIKKILLYSIYYHYVKKSVIKKKVAIFCVWLYFNIITTFNNN